MKLIRQDHIELMGDGFVLLAAPHSTETEADLYTGHIVEDAALTARCYAIVGKMGREYLDPDRAKAAQTDFEKSIASMTEEYEIRCLLDVLAKKEPGVDVLAPKGKTITAPITELVKTRLSKDFSVNLDPKSTAPTPGPILTGSGDESTRTALNHLGLRFGEQERNYQRDKVVTDIAELVVLINQHLGFKESSDER